MRRHLSTAAVMLLGLIAAPALAEDIYRGPGCIPREEARTFLDAQHGTILMRMDGSTIYDRFEDVAVSNFLVLYYYDDVARWALVRHDKPVGSNPEQTCIWWSGEAKGAIGDARSGGTDIENWYRDYEAAQAFEQCNHFRPPLLKAWDERIDEVGGVRMTNAEAQAARRRMLLSIVCGDNNERSSSAQCRKERARIQQDEERKARGLEAAREHGDALCNTIDAQLERLRGQGYRMVASLVGNEVWPGDGAQPGFLSVVLSTKSMRWEMYRTTPSGATYRIGEGDDFKINDSYYTERFGTQ